jgi:hypothetical protein
LLAPGTGAGPTIVIVSAVAGDDINNIAIANFLTVPSAIAGPNYNTWTDAHFNSSGHQQNNQSFLVFTERVARSVEVCPTGDRIREPIENVNLSAIRSRSISGETAIGFAGLVHDHGT